MTITVKILNARGSPVSRDEIASLFAADLSCEPYRRENEVSREGIITLRVPAGPVILQAKLMLPGYGHVWITADKCGKGYQDGDVVDFIREAARSRVYEVESCIRENDFLPSPKCCSLLADGKTMLRLAETASGPAGKTAALKPEAAEYQHTALTALMWAGDLAVVEQARARIGAAKTRKPLLFGCAGFEYPYKDLPEAKARFDQVFNYATMPFYLARVEPEQGKPNYAPLDTLLDHLEKAGITAKGHPLWWAHTAGMPPWTRNLRWEDGSIRRELERVITSRVRRYQGRIRIYDVINEAHDWCNAWMMSQDQLVEMTKACADAVHNADSSCKTVVNTCFMFGENAADPRVQWGIINERNMTPWSYIKKLEETGAQYEAIGMQLYCPCRDMLSISKLYDRFSVFGKPYHITELGVPSEKRDVPPNTTEGDIYCLRYMYQGLWHEMNWSERLQADWLEDFYTLSRARPEVEALTWWSFFDSHSYVPAAGLLREDGSPKEAFFRLGALENAWGFKSEKGI
ncbi:MAG: endo-1,4-beta-xylanase [Treponema sp.]|jgi:GH35 family endo-1,4-beta-xylanase|nr:endo-1,4-beta-xylanase [Treponema sp.]